MSEELPQPPRPGFQPPEELAISQARRLALAFQGVFGQESGRSADQRAVIAHLRKMCRRDESVFQQDAQGAFDPLRAAHIDGAQTQFLIIKRQLALARRVDDTKPKPKVKRR